MEPAAGAILVIAGLAMAAASLTSTGQAQGWNVADAFAADAVRPIRRAGMLLAALGLSGLVVGAPVVPFVRRGTEGFAWAIGGWAAFALGATLFAFALGVTAIVMPALGELGWVVACAAVATWLSFLHVPVFQRLAGPLWPLAVALVGVFVLRRHA